MCCGGNSVPTAFRPDRSKLTGVPGEGRDLGAHLMIPVVCNPACMLRTLHRAASTRTPEARKPIMAGSLNKATLIGNLGKDPEVRSFQGGGRVAILTIATSESWKDKTSGERKERTEWHRVTIHGDGLVGVAERYLKKGAKVY